MKRVLFFMVLGGIFIGLIVLAQSPYLTIGMEEEEVVKAALYNTFMRTSYGIKGNIELTDEDILPIELQLMGAVNGNRRTLQVRTEFLKDKELIGYYSQDQQVILTTPITGYEKLLFEVQKETGEQSNKEVKNQLDHILTHIDIKKNKVIFVGEGIEGYYLKTDQYIIHISLVQLCELISNQELSALIASQVSSSQPVQVSLFIDNALQIRRLEGILPLVSNEIGVILNIDDFDKNIGIESPDPSDALRLKGSVPLILKEFLEKQVPIY